MTEVRTIAASIAAQFAAGAPHSVKVVESPACRRGQTTMPAFDVFVRVGASPRGRHVSTIVFPETNA